jgi:hypothetical protein
MVLEHKKMGEKYSSDAYTYLDYDFFDEKRKQKLKIKSKPLSNLGGFFYFMSQENKYSAIYSYPFSRK